MKYIRKEISKGVKPIADQDFKITGDIDITGNYLQNGSPFSSFDATASNTFTAGQKVDVTDNTNPAFKITQKGTGLTLIVQDETETFTDVSTTNTYVERLNLSSTYWQYKFNINGVYVGSTTTGINDAPTVANTTFTHNGENYSPFNSTTSGIVGYADPGTPSTYRIYKYYPPFVIKADGKVGIGKTAPTQPLDVVGNINTTGNYLVNGSPLSTNITKQENKIVATSDAQTVFTFSTAFIGYDSTTPANSDLDVYWNGARLIYGTNNDYTITANNAITLTSGTGVQTGDIIYINSRNNIILDRDYTP
jgi:hypothetical protein|tara:strand:- start:25687 stop:26607 length:921 start_codon:yes stop_codon:yes gene_type:complete